MIQRERGRQWGTQGRQHVSAPSQHRNTTGLSDYFLGQIINTFSLHCQLTSCKSKKKKRKNSWCLGECDSGGAEAKLGEGAGALCCMCMHEYYFFLLCVTFPDAWRDMILYRSQKTMFDKVLVRLSLDAFICISIDSAIRDWWMSLSSWKMLGRVLERKKDRNKRFLFFVFLSTLFCHTWELLIE